MLVKSRKPGKKISHNGGNIVFMYSVGMSMRLFTRQLVIIVVILEVLYAVSFYM